MKARPDAARSPAPDTEARARGMEVTLSRLLRTGVTASLVLVVAGTVLSFVHHPEYLASPEALPGLLEPGAVLPTGPADLAAGLLDLRGTAVVSLGLLLLIATPILRVAASLFAFLRQRDRVYTLLTLVVLLLLLLSFALGKVE